MRRLIPLIAAAATLAAAGPAVSEIQDTTVNRHNEAVGTLVHQGASRFYVEDHDYRVQAEVRRVGKRGFTFLNTRGVEFAIVRKATGTRWDVYAAGHSERVGTVEKVGPREYAAYQDGERVGDARGAAAVQGAASVLVVFD